MTFVAGSVSLAIQSGNVTRVKLNKYMKENKMGKDEAADAFSNLMMQYHVPVAQSSGVPKGGSVAIHFKEFGLLS